MLYVKNKWDKRPRLNKAEPQEYTKLISGYEAILNKKSDATNKISNMKRVQLIAELLELVMIWQTSELWWFGEIIVEPLPHTWTKITMEFSIDYKPAFQKMKNLIKSNYKMIVFVFGISPKKSTLARFFERVYNIKAVTVFLILVILVKKHLLLDLI